MESHTFLQSNYLEALAHLDTRFKVFATQEAYKEQSVKVFEICTLSRPVAVKALDPQQGSLAHIAIDTLFETYKAILARLKSWDDCDTLSIDFSIKKEKDIQIFDALSAQTSVFITVHNNDLISKVVDCIRAHTNIRTVFLAAPEQGSNSIIDLVKAIADVPHVLYVNVSKITAVSVYNARFKHLLLLLSPQQLAKLVYLPLAQGIQPNVLETYTGYNALQLNKENLATLRKTHWNFVTYMLQ